MERGRPWDFRNFGWGTYEMNITSLGQTGFLIESGATRVLVDPYLYDSVADTYGSVFARMVPAPLPPEELTGIDWILLTHAHLDHTDPQSLTALLAVNPQVRVMAPPESRAILADLGIAGVTPPPIEVTPLSDDLCVRSVPAAHTELRRAENGEVQDCGYLLKSSDGRSVYHAGDTIPHVEIFASLEGETIDLALLPVNERNFFRDEAGIIGNMSVREAFQMADRLQARAVLPTHWELFAANSTPREEIEMVYRIASSSSRLKVVASGETLQLT